MTVHAEQPVSQAGAAAGEGVSVQERQSAWLTGGFLLLLLPPVYYFPLVSVLRPTMQSLDLHETWDWHPGVWFALALVPCVYHLILLNVFLFQRADRLRFTILVVWLVLCVFELLLGLPFIALNLPKLDEIADLLYGPSSPIAP